MANVTLSYAVRIINLTQEDKTALNDTLTIYRNAIHDIIPIINQHWDTISQYETTKQQQQIEKLIHTTKNNQAEHPEFDTKYKNLPSYLRRAAITQALGHVTSYKTNHNNWEQTGKQTKEPQLTTHHNDYPTYYKGNMYKPQTTTHKHNTTIPSNPTKALIKVKKNNTWNFITIQLETKQALYLDKLSTHMTRSCPTLEKRGKQWYLRFAFEQSNITLNNATVGEMRILAVDLGVNTPATCCVMEPDGTVVGKFFISFPVEQDRLDHCLNRLRKAQSKGSRRMPGKWRRINHLNEEISRKTTKAIVDLAVEYSCTHVVFEHLGDIKRGRKRGSRAQRLSLWRCRDVQVRVERHAHLWGIRFSRVCSWGTSRLAFDGSGRVKRGREIVPRGGVVFGFGWVEFSSGKLYSADLNAALNIGARFFIREFGKSMPVRVWSRVLANVPRCGKRSTCVLADLISLVKEIEGAGYGSLLRDGFLSSGFVPCTVSSVSKVSGSDHGNVANVLRTRGSSVL